MSEIINDRSLDQLFRQARSHNVWTDRPVSDVTLQALYELMCMGPTSANCSPARVLFVKSPEAKARLKPHLIESNVEKCMTAPVVAVIGYSLTFYEDLARLFPHNPEARSWFEGNAALIESTAFRNGTLQGAYLMLAARAVGLDCGPMSGFDNDGVDATFFAGQAVRSNFLCALGYGDHAQLFPRNPRFGFDDVCDIL